MRRPCRRLKICAHFACDSETGLAEAARSDIIRNVGEHIQYANVGASMQVWITVKFSFRVRVRVGIGIGFVDLDPARVAALIKGSKWLDPL